LVGPTSHRDISAAGAGGALRLTSYGDASIQSDQELRLQSFQYALPANEGGAIVSTLSGAHERRDRWMEGRIGPPRAERTRPLGHSLGNTRHQPGGAGHTETLGFMSGPVEGYAALSHLGRTQSERVAARAREQSARVDGVLAALGIGSRRRACARGRHEREPAVFLTKARSRDP